MRQGENVLPVLFAINLNDFNDMLSKSSAGLSKLSSDLSSDLEIMLNLYTLLYADDTIILAESAQELQKALGALHVYCCKWSLSVNVAKTKVVIFSKGKVSKFPQFYLGKETVEVVPNYTYLGVVFNYNGLFNKAISKQIAQARKAMYGLLEKAKILKLPIDITCDLFDKVVMPVLLYGCEIWGWSNLNEAEIFYRNFLRILLKTYKFTPNCMLYGELGTTDIKTRVMCRMVYFWSKLKMLRPDKLSSIMFKFTSKLQNQNPTNNDFKWIKSIQDCLNSTGFSGFWGVQNIDIDWFKQIFKLRCNDIFKQNWLSEVKGNSQCANYRMIKENHEFEKYFKELEPAHAANIAKFRTRTHHLPVTWSRFRGTSEDENCTLCRKGEKGDEFHFLFKCNFFDRDRKILLPLNTQDHNLDFSYKNMFRGDTESLKNIARFVKIIMSKFKLKKRTRDNLSQGNVKRVKVTRSGRKIVAPTKMNL